ncbi:dihydrofolate reductase family protein [Yinghuangia soli]|uniref:Dihydrofolate reductase family protein n=1 Tax=Yinghuangia soli TaxID=2908204 RepID=A0AA41Q4M0_9ACTN|nr:dihydrofolate reductase family protein [Yinghuangia soli]MCF2530349.1 dihydrofolate reductase family protein [Yinghuangia soli]
MSKIVAVMYTAMDGVVEDPMWTGPFWNDEHAKYQNGQLRASRALLLGRATYEDFAASWAPRDESDEFTARMNRIPKYVASTTLQSTTWNASVLDGDAVEQIAKLKTEPGGDLLVYGSVSLVDTLIEYDLLDELKLFLHPVTVGTGKRLFAEGRAKRTWTLAGTQTFSSGAIVLDYRPANTA